MPRSHDEDRTAPRRYGKLQADYHRTVERLCTARTDPNAAPVGTDLLAGDPPTKTLVTLGN